MQVFLGSLDLGVGGRNITRTRQNMFSWLCIRLGRITMYRPEGCYRLKHWPRCFVQYFHQPFKPNNVGQLQSGVTDIQAVIRIHLLFCLKKFALLLLPLLLVPPLPLCIYIYLPLHHHYYHHYHSFKKNGKNPGNTMKYLYLKGLKVDLYENPRGKSATSSLGEEELAPHAALDGAP